MTQQKTISSFATQKLNKKLKKLNLKRNIDSNSQTPFESILKTLTNKMPITSNSNSNTASASTPKRDFLDVAQWNPENIIMMPPKVSKVGYDISLLSTQLSSRLNLITPYMKTWGIQDFVDPNSGVSSGKFNMVLRFPNENYGTDETTLFLEKVQKLEEKILDCAYENRGVWFGDDETTRDVIKSKYFSMLKYQKLKDANGKPMKKLDYSKPPTFKIKVPFYKNKDTGIEKWNCQIYDSSKQLLFPSDNAEDTPVNLVTSNSDVKCKISCSSIWVGEKAWGVQWSLMLLFVKPKEVYNRFDVTSIDLGDDEEVVATKPATASAPETFSKPYPPPPALAEDSDNEEEAPKAAAAADEDEESEGEDNEAAVAPATGATVAPTTEIKKKPTARKTKA